jgi:uncharacterized protein YpmB
MSKKQILKNIQKNSNNNIKKEEKDGFYKFVTTITVILLTLIACYLLIGIFATKEISFKKDTESTETEEETEATIDNKTITAGQIFNQSDSSYYVVVYDFDSKITALSTWISLYESSDDAISVYKVDSSKKFNSKYIVEEGSNTNPTSYDDLKMTSPTMLKIENGSVSEYIEGEDAIKAILKNE